MPTGENESWLDGLSDWLFPAGVPGGLSCAVQLCPPVRPWPWHDARLLHPDWMGGYHHTGGNQTGSVARQGINCFQGIVVTT